MNGRTAQLITLAAIGGRWLREGAARPVPALATYSAFRHVGSFSAEVPSCGARGATRITSPEDWLTDLHARGFTDLLLLNELWLLASGDAPPEAWTFDWELMNREVGESPLWSVAGSSVAAPDVEAPRTTVAEARDGLRVALSGIRTFSEEHNELRHWASTFAEAEALFDDAAPDLRYHHDLLPPDASLDRRQLLAAAERSSVFGGMGSWNDTWLPGSEVQEEHERTGALLFKALGASLPAAANGE